MKLIHALGLLAVLATPAVQAQDYQKVLAENPDRYAGIYHSYEHPTERLTKAPKGYRPFYISHYGRHGSRWHSSESKYMASLSLLRSADSCGVLTPVGRDLLQKVERVTRDADGRWGDLSPRGVGEHRAIAGRMFENFPEVFSTRGGRDCNVECRSTVVIRCILSMAAFSERLKELNPDIHVTREASRKHMYYMNNDKGRNYQRPRAGVVGDSLIHAWVKPDRFFSALFVDPKFCEERIEDPQYMMYRYYILASIFQDVEYLNLSMFDVFTREELESLWRVENAYRYLTMGPSLRFGDLIKADARPLLRNIVETADEVVSGRRDLSASLRFGHDSTIVPLMCLMGINDCSYRVFDVNEIAKGWNLSMTTPMATNLQLVFYRHDKTGDVIVRILHNERDVESLPVEGAPFYRWNDLKAYFQTLYE